MRVAAVVVGALVVVLVLVGVALRVRKLRRDEIHRLARPLDRRLVTPPASPYAPSKGFRLLGEEGEPVVRGPVERPRLDPEHHYVFNESSTFDEALIAAPARHDDDWFLSRSAHRSTMFLVSRRFVVAALIVLVAVIVATYYVDHHPAHAHDTGSTTTTHALTGHVSERASAFAPAVTRVSSV